MRRFIEIPVSLAVGGSAFVGLGLALIDGDDKTDGHLAIKFGLVLFLLAILAFVGQLMDLFSPAWRWLIRHRLRFHDLATPDPHQRLLDIVAEQAHNPTTHIAITSCLVMRDMRNAKLAFISIRMWFHNYSVNGLVLEEFKGRVRYKRELWREEVKAPGFSIGPGQSGSIDLEIPVPQAFQEDFFREMDSNPGLINLSLDGVTTRVRAELPDGPGPWMNWYLRREEPLIRVNGRSFGE